MPTGVYERKSRVRALVTPVGPSIAYVPLTLGMWAVIDREDSDRVGRFNWYTKRNICPGRRIYYYAARKFRDGEPNPGRLQYLHQFIVGDTSSSIDHRDPSRTLDNRSANLRSASFIQQAHNTRPHIDNTSGLKGICWRPQRGTWEVRIMSNGIRTSRNFSDIKDAIEFRDATYAEKNGEFARVA